MRTLKFIDMFCGMGTIRMGFEQAGHKCVYSIEWDKHKRKIYEVIFGHEPEASDIRAIRGSDLPISDCWTFGAPCQDFSIAGARAGMEGDRSSLVREVFRLVREIEEKHRPEWLLYENVKGMLSSNKGLDYLEILFEMASLGYDIEFQLLNSKNFGVPQNRERVFTLGHLRTKGTRKIFPIGENGNSVALDQIGSACPDRKIGSRDRIYSADGLSPCLTSTDYKQPHCFEVKQIGNVMPTATRENPNQGRVYDPDGLAPYLNKMEGGGREPLIIASMQAHAGISDNGICPTITGAMGMGGGQIPMLVSNRIRRLTPRECMRLQGVPDYITDKLIVAGISDTQLYRAAGDACTCNVIYEIAKRM